MIILGVAMGVAAPKVSASMRSCECDLLPREEAKCRIVDDEGNDVNDGMYEPSYRDGDYYGPRRDEPARPERPRIPPPMPTTEIVPIDQPIQRRDENPFLPTRQIPPSRDTNKPAQPSDEEQVPSIEWPDDLPPQNVRTPSRPGKPN